MQQQESLEIKNTAIIRLIVDERYRAFRHIFLFLGLFVMISFTNPLSEYTGLYRYYRRFCVFAHLIFMFYVNMNILIPKFFFKGKYVLYIMSLLLLVMICLFMMKFLLENTLDPQNVSVNYQKGNPAKGFYETTLILTPVILVTTMIKLFQRWIRDNERMSDLKNLTLTMELNELRNQINPHFLFNMLNGIKALVRSNPEKATLVIMKLSEFLRYQLYENNVEKTPLRSEIDFLTNFLELEKIRRDNFQVEVNDQSTMHNLNAIFLPANIFTTFVENAIKHSIDIKQGESYIRIDINVNNHKLYFDCVNSIDPNYVASDKKNSGLGLANVKRRLHLLYGDSYTLNTTSKVNEYHVHLILPI